MREIKLKLEKGLPITQISRQYGVSKTTIARIRDGKNWKHIGVQ